MTIKYIVTALHVPSWFYVYISKPGYNASKMELDWDNLEFLGNTDYIQKENIGDYYDWNNTLSFNIIIPQDRINIKSTIFIYW